MPMYKTVVYVALRVGLALCFPGLLGVFVVLTVCYLPKGILKYNVTISMHNSLHLQCNYLQEEWPTALPKPMWQAHIHTQFGVLIAPYLKIITQMCANVCLALAWLTFICWWSISVTKRNNQSKNEPPPFHELGYRKRRTITPFTKVTETSSAFYISPSTSWSQNCTVLSFPTAVVRFSSGPMSAMTGKKANGSRCR